MKNMSRNRRPKFPTYMANKKNRGETKNRKMAGQTVLVFLQVPFKENDDGMVLVLVVVMVMMMKLVMMVLLVVVIIMLLVLVLVMMMIMVVVVEVMMMMMMWWWWWRKQFSLTWGRASATVSSSFRIPSAVFSSFKTIRKAVIIIILLFLDFKIPVELKIYLGKRTLKAAFCTEGDQIKGKFQIHPQREWRPGFILHPTGCSQNMIKYALHISSEGCLILTRIL